ncbi:MAG: hypothetical protein HYT64_02345 [Candidatus Yanofskybacteria bacterium]|nr:hypothetical protein [Candidatus Yanofskybacteria bacterium]
MERILRLVVDKFGAEEAANFVLSYGNMRLIRGLAESVQELPVELKTKLAEEIIKNGEWHDAHYFLQLVRDISEPIKERLLDKAKANDERSRQVLRVPII